MALRALFADCDSYFASCEQHLQPALLGRPVGVTPVLVDSGCCIAVSREAKQMGVKTGTRVGEARQLCPDIAIVPSRPHLYIKLHHKIVALIEDCMHVEQIYSVDELHCDLTGKWRDPAAAWALGEQIRARMRERSQALTLSIGIAPNPWLGKVACEACKPDGLSLVDEADLRGLICARTLTDLPGISKRMELRLQRFGITDTPALWEADRATLRRVWGGVEGERFWLRLHGYAVPAEPTTKRQIGHSRILPPERRCVEGVRGTCFRLLQRAAIRLRAEGYFAGALHLAVTFYDAPGWEEFIRISPTQDTRALIEALSLLWQRRPSFGMPRWCGITLTELQLSHCVTRPLFEDTENRQAALHRATDKITRALGQRAVYYACAWGAFDNNPPMRIPFSRIPNLEYEN